MEPFITRLTESTFLGNELWRFAVFFVVLVLVQVSGKVARILLQRSENRLRKGGRKIMAVALESVGRSIFLIALTIGIKIGLTFLSFGETVQDAVQTAVSVLLSLSIGVLLYFLCDVVVTWLSEFTERTESKMDDMLVPVMRTSLRITVVVLIVLQIAQILTDKPLTSIIAGLGVGGLAVALALQDTFKHFFGSLVLFADKPFQIGERIVIDGFDGPVEQLGFRSTRIRTLEGHLVTIPNGELANKTIHNIGRRPYIRRTLNIGVTYDTPPDKLQKAVDILKELLDNHEGMEDEFPPRVFFSEFNSASLNIIAIYWYHPPEYWEYMAFSEKLNMEILRRFNDEGISFAFPTQTMYLVSDPDRPLEASVRLQGGEPGIG